MGRCWLESLGSRWAASRKTARGNQGQCYVPLPYDDLFGRSVRLQDRMSPAVYDRNGDDLLLPGLYLDMPPWGYHVFDVAGID